MLMGPVGGLQKGLGSDHRGSVILTMVVKDWGWDMGGSGLLWRPSQHPILAQNQVSGCSWGAAGKKQDQEPDDKGKQS